MGFDIGFRLEELTDKELMDLLRFLESLDTQPDPDAAPLFRRIIEKSRALVKIREEMKRRG